MTQHLTTTDSVNPKQHMGRLGSPRESWTRILYTIYTYIFRIVTQHKMKQNNWLPVDCEVLTNELAEQEE